MNMIFDRRAQGMKLTPAGEFLLSKFDTVMREFSRVKSHIAALQNLQAGRVDNDVLLYWPFADALDDAEGLMKQFAVHDVRWLTDSSMGHIADLVAGIAANRPRRKTAVLEAEG